MKKNAVDTRMIAVVIGTSELVFLLSGSIINEMIFRCSVSNIKLIQLLGKTMVKVREECD